MEDSTAVAEQMWAAVQDEWRAVVAWAVAQQARDLRTLEAGLLERGHALLRGLLGAMLAGAPAATAPVPPRCPDCHAPAQRVAARVKTVHLTLGDVRLVRVCGYCPACQQLWAPRDRQLGIDQSGRSPRLVEAVALLGTELPFAPAATRLAWLCGVQVGASQVAMVTEGAGRTLAAQRVAEIAAAFPTDQQAPALPAVEHTAPWVIIALDGVLVPYRDGDHAVRTAAVAAVRPQDLAQPYPLPWRYVVHPGDVATFGRHLGLAAHRQGGQQAERGIVLGDGAHWVWNLAEEHCPEAGLIVDFWHAAEHLWAAGRALFGEDDARVGPWVAHATARLKAGEVMVLTAAWTELHPHDRGAVAAECTYFRNQAPRMRYDEYAAAGYPLGSGAVESANRHVVGVRTKQAGRRWTPAGAAGVLALRALLRSERWERWWTGTAPPIPLAA